MPQFRQREFEPSPRLPVEVKARSFRPSSPAGSPPSSPAPPVDPRWAADESNKARQLGVALIVIYVFIRFSLISEILTFGLGFKPYLIIVFGPSSLLLTLLSGGVRRSMREKPAWFMVAFMLWLLAVTPLSTWKGGSVRLLVPAFETEFTMFFMTAGLLFTLSDLKRVSKAIILGGLAAVIASRFYGVTEYGRFSLSFGSLSNANDFATHLLVIVPFALMAILGKTSFPLRIVAIVTAVGASLIIFKTGSRSALVSVTLMVCFLLFKSRGAQKIGLMAGLFVVAAVGVVTLPESTLNRYLTLFGSSGATTVDEAVGLQMAAGSGAQRKELLIDSMIMTIQHPIFGVGPGQFAVQDAARAASMGVNGKWLLTHNTYTEVSSETGIPGLILFVCVLGSTFNSVRRVYNELRACDELAPVASAALCLMMSLAGFYVSIFFAAMSYRYYVPTMVGITVAFVSAAKHELNAWKAKNPPQVSAVYAGFPTPVVSR
ncbi:MAG: O-antigen ligase family protein [Bryobacteraceae bacterium]